MTRAAEFVELDDDELQNRLASARRELLNLRFQLATGQLDNTQRIGEVRRDIARALTVLRARDLYEEEVELEPLVLTPARRIPIDESGGADAEGAEDEDEEHDHDHDEESGHDEEASEDEAEDSAQDQGDLEGEDEDTQREDGE